MSADYQATFITLISWLPQSNYGVRICIAFCHSLLHLIKLGCKDETNTRSGLKPTPLHTLKFLGAQTHYSACGDLVCSLDNIHF